MATADCHKFWRNYSYINYDFYLGAELGAADAHGVVDIEGGREEAFRPPDGQQMALLGLASLDTQVC